MYYKCSALIGLAVFWTGCAAFDHLLVDDLRSEFLELEESLWFNFENGTSFGNNFEMNIVKNFYEYDQKLKQIPDDILRGLEPIRKTNAFVYLYADMLSMQKMYKKFRKYHEEQRDMSLNNIDIYDKTKMKDSLDVEDVIRDILDEEGGANKTVHNIYDLSFGRENMLYEIFTEIVVKDDFWCKSFHQSPQQVYYNVYNAIALTGLKAYILVQFAYLNREMEENNGNYSKLSLNARINFEERVNQTMTVFRGAMELMIKDIYRCDPEQHVKGQTYEEITRLLQGHIQNEVDMNGGGTCTKNCAAYEGTTKSYGCYDYENDYCRQMERCQGTLMGCRFVESHMSICVSKNPTRRYDYVEYESGKTMGKKDRCWTKPVTSWYRWFVHCSYCMCLCDQQGPTSDRYINMRPVMADIKNNMVVTGLRIVKHNRIIHLQIQAGKLLPYGYVDNSTVHWVPVDDYKITDPGVKSGDDFYTLTHKEAERRLALDDVIPHQFNHIVTGVRFEYLEGYLRFQINVCQFDFKNGTLLPFTNYYIYGDTREPRSKIDLKNKDVPTLSPTPSKIETDDKKYVEFTHTDFEKDAAQTTIPFLDTQNVFSHVPVPLRGAGIYYKGTQNFGGFIAPKIMTYDYTKHMKTIFPKIKSRLEKIDVVGLGVEAN